MYWRLNGTGIAAPTFPLVELGRDYDLTLTLVTETDESLARAYLCVLDPGDTGLVSAKKSSESSYRAVMGLFDSNCYLGAVAAESEIDIDFRINIPVSETEGLRVVAVAVAHGDATVLPNRFFLESFPDLWKKEWRDVVFFETNW